MTHRILIMGLPGAGKTYLAQHVLELLERANKKCIWLNADRVREECNDWDFSYEGRIRQSLRMREMSERLECDYVIADFVAPLPEMRTNFHADWIVWVDTIKEGRYEDTNAMFIEPDYWDFRLTTQNAQQHAKDIVDTILGR